MSHELRMYALRCAASLSNPERRAFKSQDEGGQGIPPEVFTLRRLRPIAERVGVGLYEKNTGKLCLVLFLYSNGRGWASHIVHSADIGAFDAIGEVYRSTEAYNFSHNFDDPTLASSPYIKGETIDSVIPAADSLPVEDDTPDDPFLEILNRAAASKSNGGANNETTSV